MRRKNHMNSSVKQIQINKKRRTKKLNKKSAHLNYVTFPRMGSTAIIRCDYEYDADYN